MATGNGLVYVRAYKNTGFNAVNLPDSPQLLLNGDFTYVDYPAMDVINTKFLTSIKIKVANNSGAGYSDPESQISAVDYIVLNKNSMWPQGSMPDNGLIGACYTVNGFHFTSQDVCELFITYDPWTTNGGIRCIGNYPSQSSNTDTPTVLDGMTVRHHVATSEDLFGAYVEDDDLLVPTNRLEIKHAGTYSASGSGTYADGYKNVFFAQTTGTPSFITGVRSTVNLQNMSDGDITWNSKDITFGTNTEIFAYPKLNMISSAAQVWLPNGFVSSVSTPSSIAGNINIVPEAYCEYFSTADTGVKTGIEQARSMGVENCITASWAIPTAMTDQTGVAPLKRGAFKSIPLGQMSNVYNFEYTTSVAHTFKRKSNGGVISDHTEYHTIQNKRCLYGKYNKYCITSLATGGSTEALPEELVRAPGDFRYMQGYDNDLLSGPIVFCLTDPRPEGRPYFNFSRLEGGQWLTGGNTASLVNIYDKCVEGMQWTQTPILYTTISGAQKNRLAEGFKIAYEDATGSYVGRTLSAGGIGNYAGINAGTIAGAVAGSYGMGYGTNSAGDETFSAGPITGVTNAAQSGLSKFFYGGAGLVDDIFGTDIRNSEYFAGLNKEAAADKVRSTLHAYEVAQFQVRNNLPQPTIAFPQSDSVRDAVSNGCAVYRYRPTDEDLYKFDKCLNMYGYKITEPVKYEHFVNRSKFNYVQVAGLTILGKNSGYMSIAERNAIAEQFAAGIRIWHVKPDPSAYVNGTNV